MGPVDIASTPQLNGIFAPVEEKRFDQAWMATDPRIALDRL